MNFKLISLNEGAAQIIVESGDYSVSDIIHKELLGLRHVKFAGVAPPHPLIKKLTIQLETDGELTPKKAVSDALVSAQSKVSELLQIVRKAFPELSGNLASNASVKENPLSEIQDESAKKGSSSSESLASSSSPSSYSAS